MDAQYWAGIATGLGWGIGIGLAVALVVALLVKRLPRGPEAEPHIVTALMRRRRSLERASRGRRYTLPHAARLKARHPPARPCAQSPRRL